MTMRAALITGASSGLGLAVSDVVELLRAVLRLSRRSVTPVIAIARPGAGQTP
jgi:hypothetical protein